MATELQGVGPYDFGEVARIDRTSLPEPASVRARDGTSLAVREYEGAGDVVLVALHGSSAEGSYFHPMASWLSGRGRASVYVPDLRGHGASGGRRGDVDYVGQLEDDLSDLLAMLRRRRPGTRVILLGHSSGGGLAVRYAGGRREPPVAGYVLFSPFLGASAATTRPASGGWVTLDAPRIVELARRASTGDPTGQDEMVLHFNKPPSQRTGREVLAYSFRMMVSLAPRQDLGSDLAAIRQPLLVLAGSRDESFVPEQYEPTIGPHARGTFRLLPGVTHLGLVLSPLAWEAVDRWLETLD
jgi:alpha-beta hydrolase superfamily lysophospholipase